jgi:hypothetical protein
MPIHVISIPLFAWLGSAIHFHDCIHPKLCFQEALSSRKENMAQLISMRHTKALLQGELASANKTHSVVIKIEYLLSLFIFADLQAMSCGLRSLTGINFHHTILIRIRVHPFFLHAAPIMLYQRCLFPRPALFHAPDHKSSPDLSCKVIPCDRNPLIMTKPLDGCLPFFATLHTHTT